MINNKKGRYYILVIVFIAGVAMSATSYYLTYGYEEGRIRSEFKDAADYHFKNIEDAVQNAIAALYSFRDFYAASKSVERDEFESF